MPRTGRIVLPDHPHHIRHRGHNGIHIFTTPGDFRYFVEILDGTRQVIGCRVYAFCLMPDHVHLLVDPCGDGARLGRFMKRLTARYTRYVNARLGRRGALWESRYRSSPVDPERYLLACCRYIELNPVRARLVDDPGAYAWSSYRARAGLAPMRALDTHPRLAALGGTRQERARRYRLFVHEPVVEDEWDIIRGALRHARPTGGRDFVNTVAERLGRRLEPGRPGRPPRRRDARGPGDGPPYVHRARPAGIGYGGLRPSIYLAEPAEHAEG